MKKITTFTTKARVFMKDKLLLVSSLSLLCFLVYFIGLGVGFPARYNYIPLFMGQGGMVTLVAMNFKEFIHLRQELKRRESKRELKQNQKQ